MQKKLTSRDISFIGLFVALIAILSQISIPLPGGVPMTLQTFIVPLSGVLLGAKRGMLAAAVYVVLGAVGAPIFAGLSGGLGIVAGPTGGFLISFPLMAYAAGIGASKGSHAALLTGLIAGALLNYVIGTLWFVLVMGSTVYAALAACVLPFIPTAVLKVILTDILGMQCKGMLARAGVFV